MNVDRFGKQLERALALKSVSRESLDGTEVWRLHKPRPLAPLLDKCLDPGEETAEYAGTFEAWPGNVFEILEAHNLIRSLLTFNWDGFGPISWSAGLIVIESGGRSYLCTWDELESFRLLAAVFPAGDTTVLAQVTLEQLVEGKTAVHHPPHHIWNDAPRLLSRNAIEDAFAELLDRSQGWGSLADEHFGRIVEPNHLQRCLDLLHRLPDISDEDAVSRWLEQIDDDASDLQEPARRLLLTEFLDLGYEEVS